MKCDDALKFADIHENGSVIAGASVVCDGYSDDRTTAIFTDIDSYHVAVFETALNKCDHILVTKPIYDMLVTLKGEPLKYRNYLRTLDYRSSFPNRFGDNITLLSSLELSKYSLIPFLSDNTIINALNELDLEFRRSFSCLIKKSA